MNTLAPALLCFFLATFLAAPAAAELYQWKDENGRVHFSDTKPNSGKINTLQHPDAQRPSGRQNDDSSHTGNAKSPQERQQRVLQVIKQESDQREHARKTAEQKKKALEDECNSMRKHLRDMDGRRVYRRATEEEGGGIHYMDDKERAEVEQRLNAMIAENCE